MIVSIGFDKFSSFDGKKTDRQKDIICPRVNSATKNRYITFNMKPQKCTR